MKIGNAFAEWEPIEDLLRTSRLGTKDLEVFGLTDGGLDPNNAAGLVVHLD